MRRKVLIGAFFIVLFLTSVAISFLYASYKKVYVGNEVLKQPDYEFSLTPTPTPDPLAPRNVLILGYGGAEHEGSVLTDTMIVAHIKPRENEVVLVSIPRDIYVPIPMKDGEEYFKINHAFAIGIDDRRFPDKLPEYSGIKGAGELAKREVGLVTGLDITNFVAINFSGFKRIVDYLGGVDVFVPYTFKDEYYPIKGKEDDTCEKKEEEIEAIHATLSGQLLEKEFKCRFETVEYERGMQHLEAEEALKFVRSRHSETYGSDFGRSLRQQAFIVAVKDKLINFRSIPRFIPVINTLSSNVQTDIDIKTALELFREYGEIEDIEIESISLTTDNVLEESLTSDGQYILVPMGGKDNWEVINEFIEERL